MRSVITSLLAIFSSFLSFADFRQVTLTVNAEMNSNLIVLVDDDLFHARDNSIIITNLSPGRHQVQVYRERGRSNGKSKMKDIRNADLLYSAAMLFRPGSNFEIAINRFGQARVEETFDRNRNDRYFNDDDRFRNQGNPVRLAEFSGMLLQLRREKTENIRVQKAERILHSHYFSTDQVRAVLREFQMERNRLGIAKLAYLRVVDPGNFYQIIDGFEVESSRRELRKWVARRRLKAES